MSMRLSARRPEKHTNAATLRKWAMIFLAAGVIGQGLIQNRLLGMGTLSSMELLSNMQADSSVMTLVTIALFCQVIETCAVPLFSFLLVEGFLRTRSFEKYLIRVAAVALVSEIPYNLAIGGKFFELGSRNPAFSLLICLVMLYFFRRYEEKSPRNTLIKLAAVFCVFLWAGILDVEHGQCCALLVAEIWALREKPNLQTFLGILLVFCCMIFSVFYLLAPIGFLILHFYEGEQGEENRLVNYLSYPVILLVCGLMVRFL